MSFQDSRCSPWEPEPRNSARRFHTVSTWDGDAEQGRESDEMSPSSTVLQGHEAHCRFRAKSSPINILTNPIKGLATLGILASPLPSPDHNHFGAHIKLSDKKALLLTAFNIWCVSRLPSHSYVLLLPLLKWITVFPPRFPPSVSAYPMQGHSWSQQSLDNNAAFH